MLTYRQLNARILSEWPTIRPQQVRYKAERLGGESYRHLRRLSISIQVDSSRSPATHHFS